MIALCSSILLVLVRDEFAEDVVVHCFAGIAMTQPKLFYVFSEHAKDAEVPEESSP